MRGLINIDRNVFDHPLFEGEAYSKREAWIWLLSEAAWKERRLNVSGKMLTLQRGQLSHSTRFLAEKWDWHHSKVVRFIKRLKTETMIETASETGQHIITICNYAKYQDFEEYRETPNETGFETAAKRRRNSSETAIETDNETGSETASETGMQPVTGCNTGKKKDAEGCSETPSETAPETASETAFETKKKPEIKPDKNQNQDAREISNLELDMLFQTFWRPYPRKYNLISAKRVYQQAFEDGADPKVIAEGAVAYAALCQAEGRQPRYIQSAEKWLFNRRWEDSFEPETDEADVGGTVQVSADDRRKLQIQHWLSRGRQQWTHSEPAPTPEEIAGEEGEASR